MSVNIVAIIFATIYIYTNKNTKTLQQYYQIRGPYVNILRFYYRVDNQ